MSRPWYSSQVARSLALLLACFIVYLPALGAGFIWDDDILVSHNPLVANLRGLAGIWRGEFNPDYVPLTSTLFWIEYRLWGLHPAGYHAVNILLHAGAAILVWRVLVRLGLRHAWVGALLFAVHPVAASTVAWVAEGKNTLCLLLGTGSLLQYLRWRDSGRGYAPAVILFLACLLAKSALITLPLIFLLCEWWLRRRVTVALLWRIAPFAGLSAGFAILTVLLQSRRAIGDMALASPGIVSKLCNAGSALCFYAGKTIFPIHLAVIYPPWPQGLIATALPLLLMAGVITAGVLLRRYSWARALLFGATVYALLLLPVLGLVSMYYFVFAPVADHLQYPALPAGVGLAVEALGMAIGMRRVAMPVIYGLLAVVLGVLSWTRAAIYHDPLSLWSHAVVETPSSFQPHSAYSLALDEAGRLGEAIEQARLAVDANPVFFKSRLNYAIILDRAGRRDDALAQFSAAARLNQKVPDPWLGEARVWLEAGTYGEARTAAGRALEIDPANSIAHEYLGVISAQSGNWSDAVAQYRESARLDLSAINPRHELTDLLGRLGRWSEAVPVYQEIVRLAPESADAHNDCGVALLNSGHAAQARDEFNAALKIEPYHQAARENLLHAGSGQ